MLSDSCVSESEFRSSIPWSGEDMASSLLSPNPLMNPDRSSIRRKRKKKTDKQTENLQSFSTTQWRSEAQQQIYSSKLFRALQQVRLSGSSGDHSQASKRVHDAAGKALATAARGRSRWSRAIISSRLKLKKVARRNTTPKPPATSVITTTGSSRSQKNSKLNIARLEPKSLHVFHRKAKALGRLVPGCRKQPLQAVLEEAIDYIPALEMQVRAMSALLELLSANGSSSNGPTMDSHGGHG
ncbi:hypothetical protein M569_07618 [Genlisea aurea]|uniref:BHLH domain-containing protein n=1 Tax=Genlisea aurea TaxID=192259 RepID=S8CQK3_9LAMI|nr:hypothetical protein M569_07618 [Genlisea aurea]